MTQDHEDVVLLQMVLNKGSVVHKIALGTKLVGIRIKVASKGCKVEELPCVTFVYPNSIRGFNLKVVLFQGGVKSKGSTVFENVLL